MSKNTDRFARVIRTVLASPDAPREIKRRRSRFEDLVRLTAHHGAMCPCDACRELRAS